MSTSTIPRVDKHGLRVPLRNVALEYIDFQNAPSTRKNTTLNVAEYKLMSCC